MTMPFATILFLPPVALALFVVLVAGLMGAASPLGYKRKGPRGALDKPYAGGENLEQHRVQPDYAQFFPFAFFFTILHVVTLIVATSPAKIAGGLAFGLLYVLGAFLALYILFRR